MELKKNIDSLRYIMKRSLLFSTLILLTLGVRAQKPTVTQQAKVDTIATLTIAPNYNIDIMMLQDTSLVKPLVEALQMDFVGSSRKCLSIKENATNMLATINQEYRADSSLVWIDSSNVIADYIPLYQAKLQALAQAAGEASEYYMDLERARLEEERRIAEEQARLEAERQQRIRNNKADSLKLDIASRHHTINATCDMMMNGDKSRSKDLKDLYYAYLTIYNRFDIAEPNPDDRHLQGLEVLGDFQKHLLDSVLGQNSYQNRINNFKNDLKLRCGKDHTAVLKSYNRIFSQTNVPVAFSNLDEYRAYTQKYRDIISVQQMYLQGIELREQIAANRGRILALYVKKYKEIGNSYKNVEETIDMTPVFNTIEGGKGFLDHLTNFMQVQERYLANFDRLEVIEHRGDTLVNACIKKNYDIVVAYRELHNQTNFVPAYKTLGGADIYDRSLDEFEALQRAYIEVIRLRTIIYKNEETIHNTKGADRVLLKGYKLLQEQVYIRPTFKTVASSENFIQVLNSFIFNQEEYLEALKNQHTIEANGEDIAAAAKPYSNLAKAYNRLAKSYKYNAAIISMDHLHDYMAIQQQHLAAQKRIKEILVGNDCQRVNEELRKVSDISHIKLILKV